MSKTVSVKKFKKIALSKKENDAKSRIELNYLSRQKERLRLSEIALNNAKEILTEGLFQNQALFPKILLTSEEFKIIGRLIRSLDPVRSAAELVLVGGWTVSDATKLFNKNGVPLLTQSVNNTVTRFKAAHIAISEVYAPKKIIAL